MNTSVVSAAIIEGNLIIGLSDGSVINCGFVQGPQGLSGPQGPMGATGDNGTDGNTILTVAGTPGNEMGTDGDYAIDNINWRIYGPKSGGVWGKAKEMLPGPENILENGRAPSGSGGGSMGGSGGGEGGGIIYTNTVQLTNPVITLLRSTGQYKIIPNAPTGTTNQEGANQWAFGSCFDNFDAAIPVATGSLPPAPLAGFTDNYDGRLWFDSNADELTLYIYNNGAWIPAAPPVSLDGINATIDAALLVQSDILTRVVAGETIQARTAKVDEQNIFTENNIFRKDIALTDGVDDLIDISSTEGRIVISSDSDAKTPKITLAHFGDHEDGNRKAEIELDENGTRLDFEMSDSVQDVHFRFGDEEKFIINHEGDAEFTGKVRVEPGTETNEVVTFGQLATLEEEIEQLAPTLERGAWNFTTNSVPGAGEYTLIKGFLDADAQEALCQATFAECMVAADGDPTATSACSRDLVDCQAAIDGDTVVTTNIWSEAESIVFNEVDSNGVLHTFSGIDSDHLIDVFNESDSAFMVGDILTHGGGSFQFDLIKSLGVAAGLASIKIFKTEGAVDLQNYVRKSGDVMTGQLTIEGKSTALMLRGEDSGSSILYIRNPEDKTIFRVKSDGHVQAGDTESTAFMATHQNDVATKKYVDSQFIHPGMGLRWKYITGSTPGLGEFAISGNFSFRISRRDYMGRDYFRDLCATDHGSKGISTLMTVYSVSSGVYKPHEVFGVNKYRFGWSTSVMEFEYSSKTQANALVANTKYYITLGGLF